MGIVREPGDDFGEYAAKARLMIEYPFSINAFELYGLYMQATQGDVNTSRPGLFNFSMNARKWHAWKAVEGKSRDKAIDEFIHKAKLMVPRG